ncbi:MAG: PepSY domain-containing protein [Hyphomicrobium sp.]|uniref:PepSY domain-containing protein n=1 Tax=Hyphomicrobium sp. TaxID=82 RepID=UPI003D0EA10B
MTAAAHADDERDQELARGALLEGRIRPLAEITEMVRPHLPGTILGVEIEVEDKGTIVYEFDVLDTDGRLKEVEVDAATGMILKIEDQD